MSEILWSLFRIKKKNNKEVGEALAHAFAYMNLIEHWGSGIPRIIDKVKASGLQEPEFIGGEVDLRINIYRGQIDGTVDLNNAIKVPDTIDEMPNSGNEVPDKTKTVPDTMKRMPDSGNEVPDTTEKMPDSEQEQQIYKYVLENGSITTAETVEILDVKHRRARAVLLNMVKDGYLRKEGAARSTIYVKNTVQEVMLDLRSGNIHSYISYLKDIVDEECDLSVRAGVLIERLKAYEPELPKDMEPMVYVNYCEESDLMNPRCQKLSELDAKTAEMDKEWYAKRDPKTEEPTKIAKIYVTVYYAEKGEQMLHHFKKSMDIGNGHGGIVSQLKYDNEMKLTDEYWINYQKGKGSEEFQKYMEDLTDMQNHVLPYLQSFCNLEEKGVKERREQQIAERYEGRADERVTSTEANEVVKDVGKTDRKPAQQKQAVDGKDKKLSIHERLEINKRIIQEKQGKDKTERGVDLGVRTV